LSDFRFGSSSRLVRILSIQSLDYIPGLTRWDSLMRRAAKSRLYNSYNNDQPCAAILTRPFRIAAGIFTVLGAASLYLEGKQALEQDGALQGTKYAYGRNFAKFVGRSAGGLVFGAIGGGLGRVIGGGMLNSPIVLGAAAIGGGFGANLGESIVEQVI
jgi:hypothetical protein